MTISRRTILGLLAASILVAAAPARGADAAASPAAKAYMEYNAALGKAARLEDILPMLSSAYRQMLESRPKSDRPEWLKRLKEMAMKDVQITTASVAGNTATLAATGTSSMGNTMKGKITMVQEGGAWKLDEQGWAKSQ